MLTRVLSVLGALTIGAILKSGAQSITFNAVEGFEAGETIHEVKGWQSSDPVRAVVVAPKNKAQKQQYLQIQPSAEPVVVEYTRRGPEPEEPSVRWVDFEVLPVADSSDEVSVTVDAFGSELAFVKAGSNGFVGVFNGGDADGGGIVSDGTFPIGTDGGAQDWVRITIRQDLSSGEWDLFVDGRPVLAALKFDPASPKSAWNSFAIVGDTKLPVSLHVLRITDECPLFKDSDNDGMPDAIERAYGMNPLADDRNHDPIRRGLSNIDLFIANSRPDLPGHPSDGPEVIYVDNRHGDDRNAGRASYQLGRDAPKFSLKAAMKAAKPGSTIVVLPGTGLYEEGSRGEPAKNLTIAYVEDVTIR
jgi:hypothetical protein